MLQPSLTLSYHPTSSGPSFSPSPASPLKYATSSRMLDSSPLSRAIINVGSKSSFTTALFLMRATRCANLHVEIDSSTYKRVGNT